MNGVVNLSVKDGWWLEGYREGAGWALTEKRTYQDQGYQDRLDASTIYHLLEDEIIPLYFKKDKKGVSKGWCKVIKNSIAQIAPHYTMKRQLDDYYSKFYEKEAKRFKELAKNDKNGEDRVASVQPLKMTGHEGNNYTFEATVEPKEFGEYRSAVRMYPKNKNLPHRQDFCYTKWLDLPE